MNKLTLILLIFNLSAVSAGTSGFVNQTAQFDLLIDSTNISAFDDSIMTRSVRAYDPINKEKYEKVIVGPVQKKPFFKLGKGYTHFRYVTVYNVTRESERIAYLQSFDEDCHDNSFAMAQWTETRKLSVTLTSKVGAKALGMSASVSGSITQGITFSSSRRIKSTLNVKAIHTPYKVSDTHTGITYIQTYDSKTGSYGFLTGKSYPLPFKINNQNIAMKVDREILEQCPEN